jgi:hypothetical protein
MKIGTAKIAIKSKTTRIALGRATLMVQPIYFRYFGMITRGSALQ